MPNKTVKAGLGGPKNKAEAFIGSTIARVSSHIPRRPSAKAQCREPRRLDRSRHLGSDHCGSPSLPPLTTLVGLLTLARAVAQKINAKHNEEGDDSSCNHGRKRGQQSGSLFRLLVFGCAVRVYRPKAIAATVVDAVINCARLTQNPSLTESRF
jgi:hypothetical protein